jgi:hypothetical protein
MMVADAIDIAWGGPMSSVQGVSSALATSYAAPKPQVVQAAKPAAPEAHESAQVERREAVQGTQETGERQPQSGNSTLGSRFSATA